METLKFLLRSWLKHSSKTNRKVSGFTLLELLVGLVLAFLIIAPLLGFVVNVMNTDRQEQAKVNSEQELQSAMDYISRDLQQAVYIYDQYALDNRHTPDPTTSGIGDQLPTVPNGVPVLVFWKRKLVPQSVPTGTPNKNNDAFVYSLVAYYLITASPDPNQTWSRTARIGRFEIHDGVIDPSAAKTTNSTTPPYLSGYPADQGFNGFIIQSNGTITQSMNQWTNKGAPQNEKLPQNNILVDYIDNTKTQTVAGAPIPTVEACKPDKTQVTADDPTWTQVPSTSTVSSFYACVWSNKTTARVYLRGNALARINNSNYQYSESLSSYFPRTRIEVKSRATLGTNSGG